MKRNKSNSGNAPKVNLLYRGLNPRAIWQSLVENQIKKLQHLAAIASARITLERQPDFNPAFRVFAILEVPGPDFHAEARDHTLAAAIMKVLDNLRRQMQSRKDRQVSRRKNKLRFGLAGHANFAGV